MQVPILELLIGGIMLGGLYALMACGLNLIFGVMRIINFAHGEFLAIGALSAVSIVAGAKLPFLVAMIVVPIGMALLGLLLQVLVIRRLTEAPLIMSLLATYALSTILVNIGILIWGGGYQGLPGVLAGSVRFLGVDVSLSRLMGFLVAMGASLGVWWFLQTTRFGRAIRSVAQAPELAVISGISTDLVRNFTFALGAGMAGLAGVLMAPAFASDPQLGARFLIKAFAVIIVGGMGSYPGAIVAALLLGVVEVFGAYFFGQVIGSALLYMFMLVILLARPRGLLGVGMRV